MEWTRQAVNTYASGVADLSQSSDGFSENAAASQAGQCPFPIAGGSEVPERDGGFVNRKPCFNKWAATGSVTAIEGCKNRKGVLPCTGWAALLSLEEGKWSQWRPEPVDIPANYIFEGGIWTQLKQGMRGIVVKDATDSPVVYVLCEPPTRYWRVMTRSDRKPVFINEVI